MTETTAAVPVRGGLFDAATPWSAGAAIAATFAIVSTALLSTAAFGLAWLALYEPDGLAKGAKALSQAHAMVGMAIMQTVMVVLAVWAAGRFGGERRRVLSLRRPATIATFLVGLAGMVLILGPYNLAIYLLWPSDFTKDLRPFADLAKSQAAWIAFLVVAIGAPLSEEVLFRGFLLPALAQSRMAFWGAALFTTLAWTMMHWGYTVMGLLEVFVIGLYFCWLMWRYGSLWLTIALHAFYNAAQFALLTQITLPQPA